MYQKLRSAIMNFDFDRSMESGPQPLLKLPMRTKIMDSDDD